ncbi:MAG: hypothetical protein LQ346_005135 [Caloplaca aetnensis]|nr:MAG: hypothetical protein LQ346_005135 [Caloplaca aetnensis]
MADTHRLATQLGKAFETDGFAYLVNVPLTFTHEKVFSIAKSFFRLSEDKKLRLAKKTFQRENSNTYRGQDTEKMHGELQDLSSKLLSLLAIALEKEPSYFNPYVTGSISTLRYLHYPAIKPPSPQQELCCTPHTDSGILTLLHQDSTGGLEVLGPNGRWVAAPYVPGSLVVNIGDLMAKVSGGRFRATQHRVRSSPGKDRYSVPFFFEPGVDCAVHSVEEDDQAVIYGEHVLCKMQGWVEFQDLEKNARPLAKAITNRAKMKSFIISAVIGMTAIGLCNAAAIPANDMAFPASGPNAGLADVGDKRGIPYDPNGEHCEEMPWGEIRCYPKKRDASDAPVTTRGVPYDPNGEHCEEMPWGEIRCYPKKRDALAAPLVLPPPGPVINGTSLECASWWTVINLTAQPDPCLAALVTAQNITFAQFRKLNPDVDSTCTNLKVGYAYCVEALSSAFSNTTGLSNGSIASNASTTAPSSSAPAPLPALRVTMARTGTRRHGQPSPTAISQARFESSTFGIIRNATADVQASFSELEATGKPNTATVTHGGRPFFTATFLDGWTGYTPLEVSPSTTSTDATPVPSQSATSPFITLSPPQPTPSSNAGSRSDGNGTHVGLTSYNTDTLDQQPSPLSQFGPKVTDQAPDGQIQCSVEKRQPETCHEAPDGQIQCSVEKRDTTVSHQVDPKYETVDVYKGHKKCHKEKVAQDPGKFCQFPPCFDEKTVCERDAMPELEARRCKPRDYPCCGAPICKLVRKGLDVVLQRSREE